MILMFFVAKLYKLAKETNLFNAIENIPMSQGFYALICFLN